MVTFKEIQKLFPAKLSKEAAKELDTIRKKMNSLKTEDEKKAYFEELKRQYTQSPTTETTQKEASTTSQKPKALSSFAELGQFRDELAEQTHPTTATEKEAQPKKNKPTKTKKRKSKYSKKDLKNLYPSQEALDNAWEYLQHQPDNEKEKFIAERKEKIRIQEELTQIALPHSPDGKLSREIHTQIVNISFLPPEEREKAVKEFLQMCHNKEDKTMTEENKPYTEEEKQKEIELRKKARENLGITESGLSSGVDALEERLIKNWAAGHNITLNDELKNAAREHLKSHSNLDEFMVNLSKRQENGEKENKSEEQQRAESIVRFFIEKHELTPDDKTKESMIEYCTKHGNLNGFFLPQKKDTKKLTVSEQEIPAEPAQPQDEQAPYDERLQSIKEHWEKWCQETQDEHGQPLRNFEEIPNEYGFLKFKIEPTKALQDQNPKAKGAEVTYYSETEATMPMTDYAYFDEMIKAAKDVSKAEVIECGNIKTPGYATRLIAAAYAHDMEVEMAPNKLDLSPEIIKDIPDEVMLKVLDKQIFNRDSNAAEKVDYESIKEGLAAYKAIQERQKDENGNTKGEMKTLDISKMQFSDEAAKNKTIAAALEMGLKIENNGKELEIDPKEIEEISPIAYEKLIKNQETKNTIENLKARKKENEENRKNLNTEETITQDHQKTEENSSNQTKNNNNYNNYQQRNRGGRD